MSLLESYYQNMRPNSYVFRGTFIPIYKPVGALVSPKNIR